MLKSNYSGIYPEAGCDEAGRGCLAGPVVAASVILPDNYQHHLLNDSKQVSEKNREILRNDIEEKALAWAVAFVDPQKIDEINILNASILAMHFAIEKLKVTPEYLIIDGNKFKPFKNTPHTTIIKGDGKYLSIAAASILAKTHRDEYMLNLHAQFPAYKWDRNKGYPTAQHRKAIAETGISPFHRLTFNVNEQLKLRFD
ncbi:MAG TPA: ribonuclease HII [Bacteroidales bacterium]|nr:ribonuclease HII [Bacteroidales bacterium]HRX95607.1 ribonuclease HII [Bacteroidales bacterium]